MKKTLLNYTMMIGVFVCMVALFEGAARLYDHKWREKTFFPFSALVCPDPILGYKSIPNNAFTAFATKGGLPWYGSRYSTNSFGRRITPQDDHEKDRFLALFGCSIAFGLCLNDEFTIGAYLSRCAPEYKVYNFACQGYGTQHLYLLTGQPIEKEIQESSQGSVGLYIFNTTHIRRVIGSMIVVTNWGKNFPAYRLDHSGELVNEGTFAQAHPVRQSAYEFLANSKLLRELRVDFPYFITQKNYELTAKLIERSSSQFMQKFPGSTFYVVFYPRNDIIKAAQNLIPYLNRFGIKYILAPRLFEGKLPPDKLTVDGGHPTAEANKILAEWICQELPLQK